jgi:hypothetical protein
MTATPDRHDGESFRVSHHGYHVGYARSVAELEQWIDLADLEEALIRVVWPPPSCRWPCHAAAGTRPMCIHRSCTARSDAQAPLAARHGRVRSHKATS